MAARKKEASSKKLAALPLPAGELWSRYLPAAILLSALAVFFYGQALVFFEFWSDENIHVYVASRVAQGAALYRDVHSARPPLSIWPLALALKSGLTPLWAARVLTVLASLGSASLLFFYGRRHFGLYAGVWAASLFLISAELASRASFTGINGVALATTATVVLTLLGRSSLAAGIVAGLSLATGQHALILVAICGLYWAFKDVKEAIRFAGGAVAALGMVLGIAWGLGGSALIDDLIGMHRYHVGGGKAGNAELQFYLSIWAWDNLAILGAALLALVVPGPWLRTPGAPESPRKPVWWLLAAILAHWGAILSMAGGQILYQHPAFPLLCLLGGVGLWRSGLWLWSRWQGIKPFLGAIAATTGALLALTLLGWSLAEAGYENRDKVDHPMTAYARHRSVVALQRMRIAEDIAVNLRPYVRPNDTIFGHGTLSSSIALKLGTRVSGDWADLAPRWIEMGLVSRDEIVKRIEADQVRWFVTPRWFFTTDSYFRRYLEHCYRSTVFSRVQGEGQGIPDILVFEHTEERPCLAPAARISAH